MKPRLSDNITAIYAIFLKWPVGNVLKIKDISKYLHNENLKVELLGNKASSINVSVDKKIIIVQFLVDNYF